MDNPAISVIMSVRNNAETIGLSINSIRSQTFTDWEMLIADDGSNDSTPAVLRDLSLLDPRIKIFSRAASKGAGARYNELIPLAKGRYIARMDGDDISYPERLEKQCVYLDSHPEIDLLATPTIIIDRRGNAFGYRCVPTSHEEICAKPYVRFYMAHPTWMGKTPWFQRNPYSETSPGMDDFDLLFRTYRTSRFACLEEPLVAYREVSIPIMKSIRSRIGVSKVLLKYGSFREIMVGVTGQLMMFTIDGLAITSGLKYKVLRNRARPVPQTILDNWQQTRRRLSGAEAQV